MSFLSFALRTSLIFPSQQVWCTLRFGHWMCREGAHTADVNRRVCTSSSRAHVVSMTFLRRHILWNVMRLVQVLVLLFDFSLALVLLLTKQFLSSLMIHGYFQIPLAEGPQLGWLLRSFTRRHTCIKKISSMADQATLSLDSCQLHWHIPLMICARLNQRMRRRHCGAKYGILILRADSVADWNIVEIHVQLALF